MVEDSELRRRLEILRQQFADGKIVIAEHLAEDFKESLGKVRYATDGSVDLSTVDARVRSMAMMAAMMSDRDEVKSAASLGLQKLANHEMQWLGNVPPDALIEIRKEGALSEIRAMLTSGVDEVIALDSDDFLGSANKVYENLENAFAEHENKIKELRAKKWKFAGSDLGSWVVAGSIEVAAVLIGTPAWGLASVAVSQLTDAPKLKDIPKKAKELKQEGTALSRSATGLLFKHRQ